MQSSSILDARSPSGREANAARAMLQVFARRGVRVAFGIPGGLISSVFDALVDVPEIRLVMTRHEAMAAFCAIGHFVATGTPALVLTTSGPGITNALTGVASAMIEELPLVLIGGEVSAGATSRGAMQDSSTNSFDAVAMMRTVTRWSARIDSAAGAAGAAEQALRMATGPRPGPVFLSLPIDVGNARVSRFPPFSLGEPALSSMPDATLCREVVQRLRRAKRPLIIAGNGARGAAAELRALAEHTASPVATTPHAKGVFPERHPLHLGVTGFGGHPSVQAYLAAGPDVVCVIGSRLGDMATGAWNLPLTGSDATFQIDREPWLIGRNYPVTAGIVGDAQAVLRTMLAEATTESPPLREVTGIRRIDDGAPPSSPASGPLKPGPVFAALQDAFPDAFWACDQGEHCAYAIHYLRIDEPNQFRTMLGFVSMGTGIGLAIGARAAQQTRTVIGVCGDGGFAMHAGEVLTCVEHGIDVILVIINDGRWNMVNHGFASVYGRAPKEMPSHVADLAGVARDFGAVGVRVDRIEDLDRERLRSLAKLGRPVVLDVRIDPSLALSVESRSASFKEFVVKARP
jgi:acetolactate synthase I/II/III large subunit